jgi:hypothetical protein
LELVWTRIFSGEFFYTFAFLVLSLAIMGLGLGALTLRLFPTLNKRFLLGLFLAFSGLTALCGPPLIFRLGLVFSKIFVSWIMVGKLIAAAIILGSTYFFGGIALAMLFKNNHQNIPRLYMADLIGAGGGVFIGVILMNKIGTPDTTFLIAMPMLLAAFIVSVKWLKIIPAGLAILIFLLLPSSENLLEVKRPERAPVIYKHWDAMAKIKIYDVNGIYRGINVDNVSNSPVYPFDGIWDPEDTTDNDWGINVSYLIDQFDSCVFLSLGSGGGTDVLQALVEGATEVHAVEVNPHINRMMTVGDSSGYIESELPLPDTISRTSTEDSSAAEEMPYTPVIRDSTGKIITLADYSGHIYSDPRVKVITEDARTYIRRHKNRFDVIYSLSSNTWAALASGSFALAESYIFTTEAFRDYWEALTDSGYVSMEHQVYMPRIVSQLKNALLSLGIEDPLSHFAVYDLPQMRRKLLLISKQPLTDEIRYNAYGELTPDKFERIHLLFPAPDSLEDNFINQILIKGWKSQADSANINLFPSTDDRPFIAQMGLWKNLKKENLDKVNQYAEFYGFPLSKIVLAVILAVSLLFLIPLNLIPYFTGGNKLKAAPWLYFFLIGMAFMILEIILIQKYTLFIGASVYSFATVLLTMLIGAGIGSRFARKINNALPFAAIVIWIILDLLLFKSIVSLLGGLDMSYRVIITSIIIFPLGFFLGMPFPKGGLRAGENIDWGFAVNGAASVLGSTLIIYFAIMYGFNLSLVLGAILYIMAGAILSFKSAW